MFKRSVLAFLAVVVVAALPGPAIAQGFSGAGSTFAHPVIGRWAQLFFGGEGEGGAVIGADATLAYEPVGSLGGVMRVSQGAVDFGATDVPLAPAELARAGLAQFPFVSGGVAIVANLPGIASGALRLDAAALAAIYLGQVTRWSDPTIVALNPGVALPDAPIAVFRRSDGSGTTFHFASFLARGSEAWARRVGVGTELAWPVGTGAKGNRELAERVQATPHAIAYVEASQAARLRLPVVLVGNAAGRFLAPDLTTLSAALATATFDPSADFYSVQVGPVGADAYPIAATVYALMPRAAAGSARARRTIAFFRAGLTEGGPAAERLGFIPLPPPVVQQVEAYWRAMAAPR